MKPATENDLEEERLVALEDKGIEEKALMYDEAVGHCATNKQ
jgi:hypothetical protein